VLICRSPRGPRVGPGLGSPSQVLPGLEFLSGPDRRVRVSPGPPSGRNSPDSAPGAHREGRIVAGSASVSQHRESVSPYLPLPVRALPRKNGRLRPKVRFSIAICPYRALPRRTVLGPPHAGGCDRVGVGVRGRAPLLVGRSSDLLKRAVAIGSVSSGSGASEQFHRHRARWCHSVRVVLERGASTRSNLIVY